MRHAHLLCDDGITAELWLGALVHAGADPDTMQAAIEKAGVAARLSARPVHVRQVAAVEVTIDDEGHTAEQRMPTAAAIDAALQHASLSPRGAARAERMVTALLRAEAAVHDVAVEDVHLHELARPRTLARIVAGVTAMEDLAVETLTVGPVALGGGSIDIAHGRFPVPPPAVLPLLDGFDVRGDERQVELTTPSGAAVLAALASPAPAIPSMRLDGYGRGAQIADGHDRLLTVLLGDRLRA